MICDYVEFQYGDRWWLSETDKWWLWRYPLCHWNYLEYWGA